MHRVLGVVNVVVVNERLQPIVFMVIEKLYFKFTPWKDRRSAPKRSREWRRLSILVRDAFVVGGLDGQRAVFRTVISINLKSASDAERQFPVINSDQ